MASLFKRKRKGGGYVWCISYFQNGKTKMFSTRTGDKKLAMEIKRKIEEELIRAEQGLQSVRKNTPIRLSEFISVYIQDRVRKNKSKNTIEADRVALRQLLNFTGDCLLTAITPNVVKAFREARGRVVKSTSVNLALRHLKSAFSWAVDGSPMKYLQDNPFKQKGLFIDEKGEKIPRCLTPNEKAALFRVMDNPEYKRYFQFLLLTGCRRNEALNLTWEDVDLERHQIIFRNTKAMKSRIVPINLELMQILVALDREREKPFPFKPYHVTHLFKKYIRLAGLSEEIYLHCLRHTAASDLVRAGVHPMQIQKLLGHSSIRVTEVYVHILPEDLWEAAERLTCVG